ncbi:MAG: MFS transporter [Opitutaceae bacterium]|jgi:ACS family hexuronate transporter-like MFS transporter|nr:MFS transporter [Opitutaceae bacterium]
MTASNSSARPLPPTLSPNYRWLIMGLLIIIGYLNQFDRQTVSVLKTTIKAAFEIDDSGYALLVNAFTACYAVAYIGSGWVVDRIGPRAALTLFVAAWSLVTVGCGLTTALWVMVILRGLLGLAEPGIFPVTMRVSTVWAPDKNRGVFMALATIGTSIGSITAVPVIAWLTIHFHWRLSFVVPGALGVLLAWVWWLKYREPSATAGRSRRDRREHQEADDAGFGVPSEARSLTTALPNAPAAAPPAPALPWTKLWRRRPLWGVILVRLISDPVWYFCLFWMPGYLQESKHVSIGLLGVIGWIPFLCATLGGLAFTALSDYRAKLAGLRGRKYLVMATAAAGPLCWLIPHAPIMPTIVLFCIIAVLCNAWLGSIAPVIAQIFPMGNVASVYGIAGAFGATGAIVFNWLIGQAATLLGMDTLFIIMGCLHPCAALVMAFFIREKDMLKE